VHDGTTDGDSGAGPAKSERAWRTDVELLLAARPRHILFFCVGNSARSQMAEGIARTLAPKGVRISSAGAAPTAIRAEAVQVLTEIGVDISGQRSKSVTSLEGASTVETVITLCAEEACPVFLRHVLQVHWPLPDPSVVADQRQRLAAFRAVRDALRVRMEALFKDWPAPA
jgi:arsenate reductase